MNFIDNLVELGYKDFLIFEPRVEYDYGCIGYNPEQNKLIYDYDLLFESLCDNWSSDYPDEDELYDVVVDHLVYNTLRSLAYHPNSPIVLVENDGGEKVPYGEE